MYVVYALVDPRDNLPFYIGITDDVYARFIQHLRCDGSNFRRDARIKELKDVNLMVGMPTLQSLTTIREARTREAYWIYHYIQLGVKLVNNTIPTPLEYLASHKQKAANDLMRDAEADLIIASHENKENMIRDLRAKGFNQDEIIEKLWSAKKGSNQRYQDAREVYRKVIAYLDEAE